jgi:hypothetical protein
MADLKPKRMWEDLQEREARGKKAAALAGQLSLTTSINRGWYEDTWTETVVDWGAVAELLDKAVTDGWSPKASAHERQCECMDCALARGMPGMDGGQSNG